MKGKPEFDDMLKAMLGTPPKAKGKGEKAWREQKPTGRRQLRRRTSRRNTRNA